MSTIAMAEDVRMIDRTSVARGSEDHGGVDARTITDKRRIRRAEDRRGSDERGGAEARMFRGSDGHGRDEKSTAEERDMKVTDVKVACSSPSRVAARGED